MNKLWGVVQCEVESERNRQKEMVWLTLKSRLDCKKVMWYDA